MEPWVQPFSGIQSCEEHLTRIVTVQTRFLFASKVSHLWTEVVGGTPGLRLQRQQGWGWSCRSPKPLLQALYRPHPRWGAPAEPPRGLVHHCPPQSPILPADLLWQCCCHWLATPARQECRLLHPRTIVGHLHNTTFWSAKHWTGSPNLLGNK